MKEDMDLENLGQENIDLTDHLRRLASELPREAGPQVQLNLVAAFRARHPRKARAWVYVAAAAAILLLSLIAWRRHPAPPPPEYVFSAPGFVALPYAQSGVPMESAIVIRVQMRSSELTSMGVAVPAMASTASVQADLLVGQDGIARAVRLVH
jgi:hypothetical protein